MGWEQALLTNGLNINLSKDIARLIWSRIKPQYSTAAQRPYALGLSLDPREFHSSTCHWGKPKCSKKRCGVADRNSARTIGENDSLAGLDGPFNGEVATRIKAKNTFSSKSHAFSYVSSPFDLNDRNDSAFVGDDSFCDNVSPLEKQRAFLGDQCFELGRKASS